MHESHFVANIVIAVVVGAIIGTVVTLTLVDSKNKSVSLYKDGPETRKAKRERKQKLDARLARLIQMGYDDTEAWKIAYRDMHGAAEQERKMYEIAMTYVESTMIKPVGPPQQHIREGEQPPHKIIGI